MPDPVQDASIPKRTDVLIIGAGLSGGIVAEHLTSQGRECVMLEAGRHWQTSDFPLPELTQGQLFWKQGIETTSDGRMIVLRGKCVGGSSVVHQALLDLPPEDTLGRWADRANIDWLRDGTLLNLAKTELDDGGFRHCEVPASANNGNARHFLNGMQREGWQARQLRRAQGDCGWNEGQHCMDCVGGCPRGSKQSALVTSLPRAVANGLQIFAETQAQSLREDGTGVTLTWHRNGQTGTITANQLVLAAGSIGTTTLLLRSGFATDLPALGHQFCIHPQFNSFARFKDPVDGHLGAFQSVASDEPRFQAKGFKLECVALPRAVMALTLPWSGRRDGQLEDYRYWAGAEVSIRDASPGRIRVRGKQYHLEKQLDDVEHARRAEARQIIEQVFRAAGATQVVHGWTGISVHPMGGAALSKDRQQGVTDPDFRLHGTSRIHVCDSSLFPEALGANPSLTVMALARQASQAISAGTLAHG